MKEGGRRRKGDERLEEVREEGKREMKKEKGGRVACAEGIAKAR